MKKIGILAIHGSVAEHAAALRAFKIEPVLVRLPAELDGLDGLILPGGESTATDDLAQKYGLKKAICAFAKDDTRPIFGTCAGLILLARWGLLNVEVARNAYGRQLASFETIVDIKSKKSFEFPAIFIRAPKIMRVGAGVEILATENETPVFVRQKNIFGASFHPELTADSRVHALIFGAK